MALAQLNEDARGNVVPESANGDRGPTSCSKCRAATLHPGTSLRFLDRLSSLPCHGIPWRLIGIDDFEMDPRNGARVRRNGRRVPIDFQELGPPLDGPYDGEKGKRRGKNAAPVRIRAPVVE